MSKGKKKNKLNAWLIVGVLIIGVLVGCAVGIYTSIPYTEVIHKGSDVFYSMDDDNVSQVNSSVTVEENSLSVHFLELGNKYTGDCTYIKVGKDVDILIDCGSASSSIQHVKSYLDHYVTDGKLEYVIITHAHKDHYAGFATSTKIKSIFDLYDCENIITFSRTEAGKKDTAMFKNFERELNDVREKNANVWTAEQCMKETDGAKSKYQLDENTELQILDSYFYYNVSTTENNHSVCCMINQGEKNFLFTGDLEEDGESYLVEKNNLPKVELLKAPHHGSKTSSTTKFLSAVLDPEHPAIICVCCCAGSSEYTSNVQNQFPTKLFIDRISPFTTRVYVTTLCLDYKNDKFTSFNGNIIIKTAPETSLSVTCSNNTTLLKDSDWFKENRYEMCKNSMADSWK